MLPKALQQVIEELRQLPGVGPRSAERYALSLFRRDKQSALNLADAITKLHDGVSICEKTFVFTEPGVKVSPHYSDPQRDKKTIVVVEDPLDAIAIEKTGEYKGTYHVLGGLISPIDNIHPEQLTIAQLLQRIDEDNVTELILATNASVEGESTAMYIKNHIDNKGVKVSRLARGIPVGVDIEYTDQITLSRALENRQQI